MKRIHHGRAEQRFEQLQIELDQSQRESVEQHQRECEQQAQSVRTQLDRWFTADEYTRTTRSASTYVQRQSQRLQAIELELNELAAQKGESEGTGDLKTC